MPKEIITNGESGLSARTKINNQTSELYDMLSGDAPTEGGLDVGGDGDSVIYLKNNTNPVDVITDKYGIRFVNGILQKIVDGVASAIAGGSLEITEQATDPNFADMTAGDLIVSTASGDLFVKSDTGGYVVPGTYTVDPASVTFVSAEMTDGTTIEVTLSDTTANTTDGTWTLTGSTTGSDTLTYDSILGSVITFNTDADTFVNGETLSLAYAGDGSWSPAITGFTGEGVLNSVPAENTVLLGVNTIGTTTLSSVADVLYLYEDSYPQTPIGQAAATSGSGNTVTVYIHSVASPGNLHAVITDSSGNIVTQGVLAVSSSDDLSWVDITLDSSVTTVQSTLYGLAIGTNVSGVNFRNTDRVDTSVISNGPTITWGSLPDPLTFETNASARGPLSAYLH